MKHLRDKNLTYIGHLLYAWNFAMRLFLLSLTALVHLYSPALLYGLLTCLIDLTRSTPLPTAFNLPDGH